MSRRTLQEMTKGGPEHPAEARSDNNTIRALAYEYWLARGCPLGSPEVDWLRAEQELRSRTELVSRAA
jgi:hypothetical protein